MRLCNVVVNNIVLCKPTRFAHDRGPYKKLHVVGEGYTKMGEINFDLDTSAS